MSRRSIVHSTVLYSAAMVSLSVLLILVAHSYQSSLGDELSGLLRVRTVSTRIPIMDNGKPILSGNRHGSSGPTFESSFATREIGSSSRVQQFLVRVREQADKEWIARNTGHTLGEYIGEGSVYIVNADVDLVQSQWDLDNGKWKQLVVGQYKPEHKFIEDHFRETVMPSANTRHLMYNRRVQATVKDWRLMTEIDGEHCISISVLLEKSVPDQAGAGADAASSRSMARTMERVHNLSTQIQDALHRNGFQLTAQNQVIPVSSNKIVLVVRKQDALDVARMVSTHPEVHWIEVVGKSTTLNKEAKWITESNVKDSYPITVDKRLTGHGEIIGIADSGLDWNSCFFHDQDNPQPHFVDSPDEAINSQHRKIKGYWGLIDRISTDMCHGTHVAGSAMGQVSNNSSPLSQHNGLAEDAQVLFTDIGCGDPSGCRCHGVRCPCLFFPNERCPNDERATFEPYDLESDLFPFSYDNGARIHSNSFGSGFGMGYTMYSYEIDSFAFEHKDFLILFAAGNSADELGFMSLSTYAEAKNVLTVGASMNAFESFLLDAKEVKDYNSTARVYSAHLLERLQCSRRWTDECDFLSSEFDSEACCNITGFCEGSEPTGQCGCEISALKLGLRCCKTCVEQYIDSGEALLAYNQQNLAEFSSVGPTVDLRIKPDIVAPGGNIISAVSHHTTDSPQVCGSASDDDFKKHLHTTSGTSMATPLVAAAAALVRQFFREGYWSKGAKDMSVGFSPSSALLKAMIINSGQQLLGRRGNEKVQDSPNPRILEGFGRVQLDSVLLFGEETNHRLIVARRSPQEFRHDPSLDDGSHHDYCIDVTRDSAEFKATLVWTDPPGTPAANRFLVNNLDLAIVDAGDDIWRGNMVLKNSKDRDHLNNVEQIRIPEAKIGSYVVHVEAYEVPEGPQEYALVVTGDAKLVECPSPNEFHRRIGQSKDINDGDDKDREGSVSAGDSWMRRCGRTVAAHIFTSLVSLFIVLTL